MADKSLNEMLDSRTLYRMFGDDVLAPEAPRVDDDTLTCPRCNHTGDKGEDFIGSRFDTIRLYDGCLEDLDIWPNWSGERQNLLAAIGR